jgi:hypothetical protein
VIRREAAHDPRFNPSTGVGRGPEASPADITKAITVGCLCLRQTHDHSREGTPFHYLRTATNRDEDDVLTQPEARRSSAPQGRSAPTFACIRGAGTQIIARPTVAP